MARFDMHARRDGGAGYLLDVQADLLSGLNSRLVVPLLPRAEAPTPAARLNPVIDIADAPFIVVTQFAAAIHVRELANGLSALPNIMRRSWPRWIC